MAFPGSLPAAGTANPAHTLAEAGHTSLHNEHSDEIRAIATKVGTGSATPTSGMVLRGNGAGTSTWGQVVLTTDVTGILPIANGGTGTTSTTGTGSVVYSSSPTITTPTLTLPTIGDFTNATHSHESEAEGGTLDGDALPSTDGLLRNTYHYTYDGTDVFIDGVDQNNGDNTVDWTKPSGLKFVIVEVVGGGGAGGGAAATNGTQHSVGGGGGGGGYSRKKIAAGSLGSTEVVTVGAGATGDNDGGATGGTTSFGLHCSGAGGIGGTSSGAAATSGGAVAVGGAGGAGASGDLNINGGGGLAGFTITNSLNIGHPGDGGSSVYAGISRIGGFSTAGVAGNNYGGGGAGAGNTISQSARAGGNGANGLVIINEYF